MHDDDLALTSPISGSRIYLVYHSFVTARHATLDTFDSLQNQRGYRPDVQGIRGLAVLLVVIYHTGVHLPGGFTSLDLFLVISGFVITQRLLKTMNLTGTIDFKAFYLGRIRRLLPALSVMLTVVLLASIFLIPIGSQGITARTGAAAALVNANNYFIAFGLFGYFDAPSQMQPLLHTWSLSAEEQFYLFFPAILLAGWVLWKRRTHAPPIFGSRIFLVLAGLASFFFAIYLSTSPSLRAWDPGFVARLDYYSAPTRAWEFCAGALLALSPPVITRSRGVATLAAVIGLSAIAVGLLVANNTIPYPGLTTLLPVVGTALLIGAGSSCLSNPVSRALSIRPFTFMGDVSYSWYLWHWPLVVFVGLIWPGSVLINVSVALVALGIAWLSVKFVEKPFRFGKATSNNATLLLAVSCVVAPLLAAVALEASYRTIRQDSTINPFAMHLDSQTGCDSSFPLSEKPSSCTWAIPDAKGHAVLVGDSNAGQFTEGFTQGMRTAGLNATVATMSSCPFIDFTNLNTDTLPPALAQAQAADCVNFVNSTIADLLTTQPKLVVISTSTDSWVTSPANPADLVQIAASQAVQNAWAQAQHDTIARLESAGIQVVVVKPVPKFLSWGSLQEGPFKYAPAFASLGYGSVFVPEIPLEIAQRNRASASAAIEMAVAGTGAKALDFFPELCPDDPCLARVAGRWLYRDVVHISIDAALALSDRFQQIGEAAFQDSVR